MVAVQLQLHLESFDGPLELLLLLIEQRRLLITGKLLLLKSRALLLTEEPDLEAEEIASDLAERLATYRVFRAAAEVLRELEQRNERLFVTAREPLVSTAPAP